jgi:hypothetical protein
MEEYRKKSYYFPHGWLDKKSAVVVQDITNPVRSALKILNFINKDFCFILSQLK